MNTKTTSSKLTEDETIKLLMNNLRANDWKIDKYCLGHKHGIDISASKGKRKLVIEVKGARASDSSPSKQREYFDSGQIKTHFGKALVKVLQEKHLNPNVQVAIAHPDDNDIRQVIGHLIPFLRKLDILHYWVSANGDVIKI